MKSSLTNNLSGKSIFITGAAGYIGSHFCFELLKYGYDLVCFDNFSNSFPISLNRISQATGRKIKVIKGDIRDKKLIYESLKENNPNFVVHFAGLKSAGDSVVDPLAYYDNNVNGTIALLDAMKRLQIRNFIFSSSAAVYGKPIRLPIDEDHPCNPSNPYARSKLMIENMLHDLYASNPSWRIASLRYFNPIGAHPDGIIGESPSGTPTNIMPLICQVASGRREYLSVFGGNYETCDGTGIRDYIHVQDLADGHIAALDYLKKQEGGMLITVNLGTGKGHSVLELVSTFTETTGRKVAYKIESPRQGDVSSCYADPSFALNALGWRSRKSIHEMCMDAWMWHSVSLIRCKWHKK